MCDANKQRTHCKRIHAEDTLWTGTPGNYTNPNAPEALLEVRKLVDSGKFSEATSKAVQLTGNPAEVLFFFLSMAALLHLLLYICNLLAIVDSKEFVELLIVFFFQIIHVILDHLFLK